MLALVLFAVLVWYAVVSPSYRVAPLRAADDEPPDAEERETETHAAVGFAGSGVTRAAATRADEFREGEGVDELDWPEIIGGD